MDSNNISILIMSGADDGKVLTLDKDTISLGRHPDDDVCLPYDARTSRHHAIITQMGDSYFIEDVGSEGKGSTNGTYVNEKRTHGKTPISSGDMILLGNVWIRFYVELNNKNSDKPMT